MTKAEFISVVTEKAEAIGAEKGVEKKDITKKMVDLIVTAFTESVQDVLVSGDKIQLVGFGTFEVRERAEREGVNPQTREKMRIPATKSPVFKAGKNLKDAIAES